MNFKTFLKLSKIH